MLDGWNEENNCMKRINGREYYGQGSVEADHHYEMKGYHCIFEYSLIKIINIIIEV